MIEQKIVLHGRRKVLPTTLTLDRVTGSIACRIPADRDHGANTLLTIEIENEPFEV
jgi:hypothetical protein